MRHGAKCETWLKISRPVKSADQSDEEFEFEQGRVAVQRNYDCFEPW
jgi:hypothetical protein